MIPCLERFGVETFDSVKHRIKNLLDDLLQKHEDSNVLIVTHLDPIKAALATLLDLEPAGSSQMEHTQCFAYDIKT